MGRFVKNVRLESGAYVVQLPRGTASIGPAQPATGVIRYDDDTDRVIYYNGTEYKVLTRAGRVTIVKDYFVGDGTASAFSPMSYAVSDATSIMVFVGGVYQEPSINYTVDGTTTITFTSPPPAPGINPNRIVVLHGLASNDVDQTNPVAANFNGIIDGGTY
jgi:hypothetical protein